MVGQLKSLLLHGLEIIGALEATTGSAWRRNRLLLLCYHGVSMRDEHEWLPPLYLSPQQFASRMAMLADMRCNVLPLGEAVQRLENGSLPPRAVVITFDDGFADFRLNAVPVLQRYGFPATVYLTTHYVKHRCAIFNLITDYMLWRASNRVVDPNPAFGWDTSPDLATAAGRKAAFDALTGVMLRDKLSTEEKEELASRLAAHLGIDYAELRRERMLELLSPEEVVDLGRVNVDVQLHTHRHRSPAQMDLFEKELTDNRRVIEELTGRTPEHFCYPSGVVKPGMYDVLRTLGVRSATTCALDIATRNTDPFRLPRLLDSNTFDRLMVKSWVSGFAAFLPNRAGDGAGEEYPYVVKTP